MKPLNLGLLVCMLTGLFTACRKENKTAATLSAEKTTVNVGAESGYELLQINSNTDWKITGMPDWLTVSPASGTGDVRIELSFSANTSASERTATLTLADTNATTEPVSILLHQAKAPLSISSFTGHAKGGEAITITGSGFSGNLQDNIVTINEKRATVTAMSGTSLTVTVPAKAGNGKVSVTVGTQSATSTTDFIYDWVYQVSTLAADPNFVRPFGIAVDGSGYVYMADVGAHKIFRISATGDVFTVAGNGWAGAQDGKGVFASFNIPAGVAVDGSGNLFVADYQNHKIRMITPDGTVSTWAGDGGMTLLANPCGLALDGNGNVFVADQGKDQIIKIGTAADGSRTYQTVAGSESGFADGNGLNAKFFDPTALAFDGNGNLYVADQSNNRIRKIAPDATVTTIAGYGGADILNNPCGVAAEPSGSIFMGDHGHHRVRSVVKGSDGNYVMSSIAGIGIAGHINGPGANAAFNEPNGVAIDKDGNIYVAEAANRSIRKLTRQ